MRERCLFRLHLHGLSGSRSSLFLGLFLRLGLSGGGHGFLTGGFFTSRFSLCLILGGLDGVDILRRSGIFSGGVCGHSFLTARLASRLSLCSTVLLSGLVRCGRRIDDGLRSDFSGFSIFCLGDGYFRCGGVSSRRSSFFFLGLGGFFSRGGGLGLLGLLGCFRFRDDCGLNILGKLSDDGFRNGALGDLDGGSRLISGRSIFSLGSFGGGLLILGRLLGRGRLFSGGDFLGGSLDVLLSSCGLLFSDWVHGLVLFRVDLVLLGNFFGDGRGGSLISGDWFLRGLVLLRRCFRLSRGLILGSISGGFRSSLRLRIGIGGRRFGLEILGSWFRRLDNGCRLLFGRFGSFRRSRLFNLGLGFRSRGFFLGRLSSGSGSSLFNLGLSFDSSSLLFSRLGSSRRLVLGRFSGSLGNRLGVGRRRFLLGRLSDLLHLLDNLGNDGLRVNGGLFRGSSSSLRLRWILRDFGDSFLGGFGSNGSRFVQLSLFGRRLGVFSGGIGGGRRRWLHGLVFCRGGGFFDIWDGLSGDGHFSSGRFRRGVLLGGFGSGCGLSGRGLLGLFRRCLGGLISNILGRLSGGFHNGRRRLLGCFRRSRLFSRRGGLLDLFSHLDGRIDDIRSRLRSRRRLFLLLLGSGWRGFFSGLGSDDRSFDGGSGGFLLSRFGLLCGLVLNRRRSRLSSGLRHLDWLLHSFGLRLLGCLDRSRPLDLGLGLRRRSSLFLLVSFGLSGLGLFNPGSLDGRRSILGLCLRGSDGRLGGRSFSRFFLGRSRLGLLAGWLVRGPSVRHSFCGRFFDYSSRGSWFRGRLLFGSSSISSNFRGGLVLGRVRLFLLPGTGIWSQPGDGFGSSSSDRLWSSGGGSFSRRLFYFGWFLRSGFFFLRGRSSSSSRLLFRLLLLLSWLGYLGLSSRCLLGWRSSNRGFGLLDLILLFGFRRSSSCSIGGLGLLVLGSCCGNALIYSIIILLILLYTIVTRNLIHGRFTFVRGSGILVCLGGFAIIGRSGGVFSSRDGRFLDGSRCLGFLLLLVVGLGISRVILGHIRLIIRGILLSGILSRNSLVNSIGSGGGRGVGGASSILGRCGRLLGGCLGLGGDGGGSGLVLLLLISLLLVLLFMLGLGGGLGR
ncbi:hypothetical protein BM221_007799 [Beauveria bassiana]|uniref:Uncharacterized protein n=1 Tax=Beauveria bassiana TaxID=176275 RepID=A0A2N6NHN6_BEABA|nr:hypothetical protein BM221_007799 [Beauveria bassiana]